MSNPTIVHPTDFGKASVAAYHHALRLAVALNADLDIVHVYRSREALDQAKSEGFPQVRDTLVDWGLIAPGTPERNVGKLLGLRIGETEVVSAEVTAGIARYIAEHAAGWVVLATAGRHGLTRWLRGSVAERISGTLGAATLFVPQRAHGFVDPSTGTVTLNRVLIPVDHQPDPKLALALTTRLLAAFGMTNAAVDLLHIGASNVDAPAMTPPTVPGLTFTAHRRIGNPAEEIVRHANESDCRLIVMATSGRHGALEALLGSTTQRVLEHSRAPVLAVPAGQ